MSRFPSPFELAARRAFAEQSGAYRLVSEPLRYQRDAIVVPDDDRDPGDEDPSAADHRVYRVNGQRLHVTILERES